MRLRLEHRVAETLRKRRPRRAARRSSSTRRSPSACSAVHLLLALRLARALVRHRRGGVWRARIIAAPLPRRPLPPMPDARFTYSLDTLREMVAERARLARERARPRPRPTSREGYGQTVTVRRGEVETIEYNRDKGLGVTRLHRQAARLRELLRPRAEGDPRHGRGGALDRALHRRRRGGRARRPGADLALEPRPRPLPPVGPAGGAARSRSAKACEAAALRGSTRASSTPRARASRPSSPSSSPATSLGFLDGYRELAPLHLVRGHRRARATRCSATTGTRRSAPSADLAPPEAIGDYAGRARARAAAQPQARQAEGPRAVRSPGRERPARALRLRGERRQPLPQELVSRRQPRHAGLLADRATCARSRTCGAARRAPASTTTAWRARRATS